MPNENEHRDVIAQVNADAKDEAPEYQVSHEADTTPRDVRDQVRFTYVNHKERVGVRSVDPISLQWLAKPPQEYYPGHKGGWFLQAFEEGKGFRTFDLGRMTPDFDHAILYGEFDTVTVAKFGSAAREAEANRQRDAASDNLQTERDEHNATLNAALVEETLLRAELYEANWRADFYRENRDAWSRYGLGLKGMVMPGMIMFACTFILMAFFATGLVDPIWDLPNIPQIVGW